MTLSRIAGLSTQLRVSSKFTTDERAGIEKRITGGFRPFAIRTTDGQEFEVPHPEFILIGKYSVAVRDKEGFINTFDPLYIVSAKELARRNGGSQKRES